MIAFDWNTIDLKVFSITNIENRVNADKLFVSLLMELERKGINPSKEFTISEVANLIPKGTANVCNHSTYGFSIMSMFSGQKYRDYFIFEDDNLRDEFTKICNNNHDRDNYYWRKYHLNKRVKINPKYLKV